MKLILWDIDGTLLYSGGVAGEAMRAAMTRVYGRPSLSERSSYAGKTDQQIIMETFADRSHDDLLGTMEQFTAIYVQELESRRDAFLSRGYVLAGVVTLIENLAQRQLIQSVLTGNMKPAARFKLDLVGLTNYLDLEIGAYGSDHHRRADLVPIAVRRAEQQYGRPLDPRDVVVIGDTPHDIDCGRVGGARTVGVASGPFGVEQLHAAGADAVLPDLSDTAAALRAILGPADPDALQ